MSYMLRTPFYSLQLQNKMYASKLRQADSNLRSMPLPYSTDDRNQYAIISNTSIHFQMCSKLVKMSIRLKQWRLRPVLQLPNHPDKFPDASVGLRRLAWGIGPRRTTRGHGRIPPRPNRLCSWPPNFCKLIFMLPSRGASKPLEKPQQLAPYTKPQIAMTDTRGHSYSTGDQHTFPRKRNI